MKILLKFRVLLLLMLLPAMSMSSPLKGDVNGDGSITIADVTALIDILLQNHADTVQLYQLDMNEDNEVNIGDVTCLIDFLLGSSAPNQNEEITITANGISFTMVLVEGGQFMMGATDEQAEVAKRNEFPAHEVTLSTYYIGQTEVTQELWEAIMGDNPSVFQGDPMRPVENIDKFDCAKFVDKLTELTGRVFRMPTEAEWEFAARGGNLSSLYRFSGSDDVNAVAWYDFNAGGTTHAVALMAPNELGLYDMSGNVCEWCQDWFYMYDFSPQVNPVGPESGTDNVYRGGSWFVPEIDCRVSSRFDRDPHEKSGDLGLRIVMNY